MSDTDNYDEPMSETQVEILKAEIHTAVKTAGIILGALLTLAITIMTTFGLLFYQQGREEHDQLVKLTQKFEDLPKPPFDVASAIQIASERVMQLQRVQAEHEARMNLQGNVMNTLQQTQSAFERRLEDIEKMHGQ